MGNSNSQSVSRLAPSLLHGNQTKEGRSRKQTTKFANPENRVLPTASGAPQRLRSTNNGSILHSGGTISGRKSNIRGVSGQEPEFLQLLQKKNQPPQVTSENQSLKTLYGHRKSHSDPDIVRMMMCDNESEDDDDENDNRFGHEVAGNHRSVIAVSPSKAKIKSRKKNRAPEPPHSNTLPRSFDRMSVNYTSDGERKSPFRKLGEHNETPRRPLPPIPPEELPPPPPPPPPDYNHREMEERGVTKTHSKNYEKNRRTVDKWKFTKPVIENNIENVTNRPRPKSFERLEDQQTIECAINVRNDCYERKDSFKNMNGYRNNEPNFSGLSKRPTQNELQAAIVDAARRRAERLEKNKLLAQPAYIENQDNQNYSAQHHLQGKENCHFIENKKHYYFAEQIPIKQPERTIIIQQKPRPVCNEERKCETKVNDFFSTNSVQPHRTLPENKIERNNVAGAAVHRKKESNVAPATRQRKWDLLLNEPIRRFLPDGTPSSCSSSEEEMEIDLQLRPTLPRRPVELPRFSPTDVWKSINVDFFKSYQHHSDVSSDDGDEVLEDKIHRINRPVAPRRLINDRSADSGISPDAGSPMPHVESFETLLNSNVSSPNRPSTPPISEGINSTWIPQHDLADDSDSGSEHLPKAVCKTQIPDSQATFSMPNLMFPSRTLPRTEQPHGYFEGELCMPDKEKVKNRGRRKKSYRNTEGQHFNSLRNLKKALGLRSKSPTVPDNSGLDSNWSLSRSLPNFTENLPSDTPKRKIKASPYSAIDAIRRSNSESRALQQGNNEANKQNLIESQVNVISHIPWKNNSFIKQSPDGHVIYLPEYSSSSRKNRPHRTDDMHVNTDSELVVKKSNGRKKFSYQSTVRQEEKKKLEEQLAKEVEARERQRQKEIEWMNKVEEEFRKQRDKEKINIRHQLRILNLQEKSACQKTNGETRINQEEAKQFQNHALQTSTPKCQNEVLNGYQSGPAAFGQESSEMGYNNWKPTGMRKWLKRQNRYGNNQAMSPVRPEPEGGRSSSDDCRQLDWKHDAGVTRSLSHRAVEDTEISSKYPHTVDTSCNRCTHGTNVGSSTESSDRPKSSPSPEVESRIRTSTVTTGKKLERGKSNGEKPHIISSSSNGNGNPEINSEVPAVHEDYRFIRESVEEYELHTRLCRTNSGRTFESHSYYALERLKENGLDNEESKNTTNKREDVRTKNNVFSTLNFQTELKENVRKKTKEFEKRTRKHAARDYESDDSGSDTNEVRHQRHGARTARKKRDTAESREPSFSRNHPHRSAARKIGQVNGLHMNGRLGNCPKATKNDHLLAHHRISGSVIG